MFAWHSKLADPICNQRFPSGCSWSTATLQVPEQSHCRAVHPVCHYQMDPYLHFRPKWAEIALESPQVPLYVPAAYLVGTGWSETLSGWSCIVSVGHIRREKADPWEKAFLDTGALLSIKQQGDSSRVNLTVGHLSPEWGWEGQQALCCHSGSTAHPKKPHASIWASLWCVNTATSSLKQSMQMPGLPLESSLP